VVVTVMMMKMIRMLLQILSLILRDSYLVIQDLRLKIMFQVLKTFDSMIRRHFVSK
jgi:hypothetical protein